MNKHPNQQNRLGPDETRLYLEETEETLIRLLDAARATLAAASLCAHRLYDADGCAIFDNVEALVATAAETARDRVQRRINLEAAMVKRGGRLVR